MWSFHCTHATYTVKVYQGGVVSCVYKIMSSKLDPNQWIWLDCYPKKKQTQSIRWRNSVKPNFDIQASLNLSFVGKKHSYQHHIHSNLYIILSAEEYGLIIQKILSFHIHHEHKEPWVSTQFACSPCACVLFCSLRRLTVQTHAH